MSKTQDELKVIDVSNPEELLDEVQQHQTDSDSWLSTIRDTWDDKESMLLGSLEDSQSKNSYSKVNDPRLATIVFERAARVMARDPKGKARAVSKDDVGKNLIMNLMLDYYYKEANEQFSMRMKLRLLDLYSHVYGSMFALVPWRVNTKNGYMGPELNILNIRDCFPQPGNRQVTEADWFIQRSIVGIEWLKSQNAQYWNMDEVQALADDLKTNRDGGDVSTTDDKYRSLIENERFPSTPGDVLFPQVELFTEYRRDKWITFATKKASSSSSRPYVLRVVENPYCNNLLPIVVKHSFPLLDSPIGLGEFERGKTLQFAINSLINLYLDGVKYSIFPPLAVNPNEVVPSSLKWGVGEKWFMKDPKSNVVPINLSPQGLNSFNSTYGFLLSALNTQAGTTDVAKSNNVESSLGKTPQALKYMQSRENSRDEWDRFMIEDTVTQIMDRWTGLMTKNLDNDVAVRIFGTEIEELREKYPDASEMFNSGKAGIINVNKTMLNDDSKDGELTKYDYQIEAGSTFQKDPGEELQSLATILKSIIENPAIIQLMQQDGKKINFAEIFKRWVTESGIRDFENIVTDMPQQSQAPEGMGAGAPPPMSATPGGRPMPMMQFNDPEIARIANEMLGGLPGIPSTKAF